MIFITGIWPMDLNFLVFAMRVCIFRASNDVGPLFVGPGSTWMLEKNNEYWTKNQISSISSFSKCLKNETPVYLKNKIQYLSDRNPFSLRNVVSEKLQIPKAKTELFKKTFTYSGPKLWNELPFSIRQASSHNAFKTKVKSLILNDDVP